MKVYLVGAGPGDPGLLTVKGKHVLEKADVIIYDYLANESLLSLAKPEAELLYAGKKGGDHTLPQDKINSLIIEKAKEGKTVARLKGGDPYMFGRGAEEAEGLLAAGISFEEIPGITSAIAGPAYAGIPLTHRSFSSSVCFITGHETPDKEDSSHNWEALAKSASTLVFFMGMKNLPEISQNLIKSGLSEKTPAALVHWGTTSRHKSLVSTLQNLPEEAIAHKFTSPSLIVVGNVVSLHDSLNWFEKLPLLGKTVVVTRAREQASESATLLEEKGAHVIQFPTIDIAPLDDYSSLHNAFNVIQQYQWIIFTSVNGVQFFWKHLVQQGKDTRSLGGIKIAAIGSATAEALHQHGIVPDFVPEKFVAEEIAEGLIHLGINGQKILLPRAKIARSVLPEMLRKAGATVEIIPVYETLPNGENSKRVLEGIQKGEIDCITFGSSSTVENFLSFIPAETLRKHPNVKLACIGSITAATLTKAGLHCDIQPQKFTIPGLVDELSSKLN